MLSHLRAFIISRAESSRRGILAPLLAAVVGVHLVVPCAEAQKRIYIANDDHTDYFWTATDVQYRAAFLSMLDYYLNQIEATAGNPSDSRGRFNCDGSLWVRVYEQNRSAADFARLVGHLRDDTISMPLNTLVLLYGAMPTEAVLRNMYYAGRLERSENLRFPLVVPMENQTLPGGVASLWAGSGAKYAWKGVCGCATKTDWGDRPREIYHFTGPDGQSVCVKWNTMLNGNQSVGGYAEAADPYGVVDYLDNDAAFLARWPWPVSAAFGHGWDALQTTTGDFIAASQTQADAGRRVIVSNEKDFFEDFLSQYSNQIPTFSGSFGNEWDLYTASMAEVTAGFRRQVERLRTAEALATVASLHDASFMAGREIARDRAFVACGLFYEHDWTGDGPVARSARAQFQRDQLDSLSAYVNPLYADALTAVASRVSQPGGSERHIVFNPLSWVRTDIADLSSQIAPPLRVVDVARGTEVRSQVVSTGATTLVRVLADSIPPVGYRVFEVRSGAGQSYGPAASVTLPGFDNGIYAVALGARGNITSLVDHKDSNRQLVAGGGSIHDQGSGAGTAVVDATGPVYATLKVVAGGTPAHETRVTLYAGLDRVDIDGRVTQNFSSNVGYTSAFNLPGSAMRHEEVGMIARVARAAAGGDYADENARTDYLTFNHFVDLSQTDRGVTVSNWDSPFFQAGASTPTFLDSVTPSIRAVVGMQVDGATLGMVNQGGDTSFLNRFSLRTHGAYDQAAAMRFALEHQNPLVAARATGGAESPLPATVWSLLSIDSPDVLLWALKPAEEGIGSGMIARVWNLAEAPRAMNLTVTGAPVSSAMRTTHIETDIEPASFVGGTLSDNFARQEMRTYRMQASVTATPDPERPTVPLSLRIYPNPAPSTRQARIAYSLPTAGQVRITVFDAQGRRVATLRDGEEEAGPHELTWEGSSAGGTPTAPGIYFVQVRTPAGTRTSKFVRIR
jgi:alpha-mannosidase